MNIAALKEFAPAVRRQLMEAVTLKLNFVLTARTPDFLDTYARQVAALHKLAEEDRAGLVERVAYTWFNRLTALRFLDARGWHPFGVRVLTPATASETQPELLKIMRSGGCPEALRRHTNIDRLNGLLDGRIPSVNPHGEVYRHLVLAACRFYNDLLPDVFERLDDETELLLPDDMLTEQSVADGFRSQITDEDCREVEIIGWLYQFYISERKAEVMARKSPVPKADIPAVTQIFTPHWIVRYLVENSVGRIWLLNRPDSRLRDVMRYYIEGEPEADFQKLTSPEELRVLDPAVGSGHMLTYAFELLYSIYEEEGYSVAEIPGLILKHNLYGLDISPRAAQLAEMALVFKAREKSRAFLEANAVRPNVMELCEIRFAQSEIRDYIHALNLGDLFDDGVTRLLHQFEDAKNVGSLIQPYLDHETIAFIRGAVEAKDTDSHLFLRDTHRKVLNTLDQAEVLSGHYHVVVANPPYMGAGQMNPSVKSFIENHWSAGKSDAYAAFILRNLELVSTNGFVAMITIPNWMSLTTFEALRENVLRTAHIKSLIHCGRGVWGADFGSCAFVLQSSTRSDKLGTFRRLFQRAGEVQNNDQIESNFFDIAQYPLYRADSSSFRSIPGTPIAYWISPKFCATFRSGTPIGEAAKKGLSCSGTELFYRYFWEVELHKLAPTGKKWFPITKGGAYRKWFGNNDFVIDWADDGAAIKDRVDSSGKLLSAVRNERFYFQEGGSWNDVSIGSICCRYTPPGSIPTDSGPMLYSKERLLLLISFINSVVAKKYAEVLCPTVHFGVGQVACFPVYEVPGFSEKQATRAIEIAKADWNAFEVSSDFDDLPLLRTGLKGITLEASWQKWNAHCIEAIQRMQELEMENNKLFIEAYGLHGELSPEVPDEQITLARADARRDLAAFLSYAVGCMMGRYSLDKPGLILADAGAMVSDYYAKLGKPLEQVTFAPDEDGIIPVLDGEWFEDDVVGRAREFLRSTFGEAALRENVRFVEDSLGKDLRKYFLTDFYQDHLQTYKKRPIYWMVQSPKRGFSALIYLHRYTRDTMNLVLNRYLREYEAKLRSRITHLDGLQTSTAVSAREKSAARKEFNKLTAVLHDCEEWERQVLLPLAQARIELDLDDGVKVNYLKLGEALAPIPGLAAAED